MWALSHQNHYLNSALIAFIDEITFSLYRNLHFIAKNVTFLLLNPHNELGERESPLTACWMITNDLLLPETR